MSFWTVGGPSAAEQVRGARGFSLTFSAGTGGPSAADRPTEKLPGCFSPQSYACLRAWGKCQSKYKPQEGETGLLQSAPLGRLFNLSGTKVRGVGFCKLVSVKSVVQKSAVDGTKKCGRGTQKKSYPV
jgi:hypothetical protein